MAVIGNNGTPGANTRGLNATTRAVLITTPQAIAAGGYSIWAYISDAATGNNFKGAILASDGSTVLAESAVRTNISTVGWYEFSGGAFDTYALSNATQYLFTVASDSAADALIYWDDPLTYNGYSGAYNVFSPLSYSTPIAIDGGPRDFYIYLEYAEGGTTVSPLVGALRFVGNIPTLAGFFPFDESIYPNGVTLANLSGAYTDIDESPDAPDGNWLTAT